MNSIMKLDKDINTLVKQAKKNAPAILTVLGVVGFVSTAIMAAKATPKAMDILEEVEKELPEDMPKIKKTVIKVKNVATVYAPAVIMGVTSGLCIFKAYDISAERLTQVITACEFKDQVLKEYQKKVVDTIGEAKERVIRDEISQDHANKIDISDDELEAETGQALFIESITGKCFYSTRDDVWKATRNFERLLFRDTYCTCQEWFNELDLTYIPTERYSIPNNLGFNINDGFEIHLSVVEAPNGQPATMIEYYTPPTYDYKYR